MRMRLGEVLLGHQHGELVMVLELLDGVDGAGAPAPARGRPRARRSAGCAGLSISARASASICCSPPLIEPASWRAALGQPRKDLEAEIHVGLDLRARLAAAGAEQQIFLHGLAREQAAAFRHQRDAEIDDLLGGQADEVVRSRRRSRRRSCPGSAAPCPSRISSACSCRCRWCRAAPRSRRWRR